MMIITVNKTIATAKTKPKTFSRPKLIFTKCDKETKTETLRVSRNAIEKIYERHHRKLGAIFCARAFRRHFALAKRWRNGDGEATPFVMQIYLFRTNK